MQHPALEAETALPAFHRTGETDVACLSERIRETLVLDCVHHIERLMVTGLFALLWGVRPREVHEWYLAVYVDAADSVELRNTLGMSQFADGGLLASMQSAATGRHLARMGSCCDGCRDRPGRAHGAGAGPFTTLYRDLLGRHHERFALHPRPALQVRNLDRLSDNDLAAIAARPDELRPTLERT